MTDPGTVHRPFVSPSPVDDVVDRTMSEDG
jgi:hypothetical protein